MQLCAASTLCPTSPPQVTRILPSLKQIIRLPDDVDLLERLNNAMSNAMTDNDRDVSLLARQVNDSYKRTPVRMGECRGAVRWVVQPAHPHPCALYSTIWWSSTACARLLWAWITSQGPTAQSLTS